MIQMHIYYVHPSDLGLSLLKILFCMLYLLLDVFSMVWVPVFAMNISSQGHQQKCGIAFASSDLSDIF